MKSSASSEEEGTDETDAVDDDISDVEDPQPNDSVSNNQQRMFQLSLVNIYGNAEVNRLSDDDKQIKFGSESGFFFSFRFRESGFFFVPFSP